LSTPTVWSRFRLRPALPLLVAALMLVVASGVIPTRADDHSALAGRWTAKGQDPGEGQTYAGTVLLTVKGDSLLYQGEMHGETYRGVGIWDPATGTLALDFVEKGTSRHGVAQFVLEEGVLNGRWVFSDAPGDLGPEVWTRADE
jgi:hypothetical protein